MKIRSTRLTGLIFVIGMAAACSHHYKASSNNEAASKSLKIAVISDLNASYGSVEYDVEVTAVIKKMKMIKPDIILCGGDMVAGQKASLSEQTIKAMWQGFKQAVLTPVQELNIPFGFTLGNHDASPSYLTDRAMAKRFWMENVQATGLQFIDSTHYPFYFSYILSNIFFISWDAAGAKVPAEVYEWMNKQLAGNTAREAKLRILLGHLPLYPIVEHKNKPGEVNASADSALFFLKNNGIDLYISGHQHAFYPAKKDGIRLLNAGCIGSGERKIMGHTDTAKKAYTIIEVPARSPQQFHYTTYIAGTDRMIDPRSLPDSVVGFNGVLHRED